MADVAIILKALDKASGPLSGVTGELDKMSSSSSKLGGILKGGLVVGAGAAVAGIGSLAAVLGTSISAASEAEEIGAQLNAVLESTGGIAGMTADAINDHALALSEVTRFEDDAIVAAQSLLLTFTKIGKDVFPDATEATLDMAQSLKMDLKSASMLVGKALNDPIKGMTALTRSGIQFTKEQTEMVAAMVEVGDMVGAQRIILKELETQFGGSAKAAGETLAGQLDILKNSLGNVKEEIGGALLPIIKQLVAWVGPRLVDGFKKFSSWITGGITDIRQLAGTLGKAKDIVGDIIRDVQSGKKIDWQDLMNLSGLFTNELDVQRTFGKIVKNIENGILEIKTAFETGGIGGVAELVWKSIGDFWENDAVPFATEVSGKIKTWVSSIDWDAIGEEIKRLAGIAWDSFSTVFLDENKQAQLAWDIQAGIKGMLAQVQLALTTDDAATSSIADSLATSFKTSFADSMRGPTAPVQDFVALILDYAFPEIIGVRSELETFWSNIGLGIGDVKRALQEARQEKQLFEGEMAKAFSNPFAAVASAIQGVIDLINGLIDTYNRWRSLSGTPFAGVSAGGTVSPTGQTPKGGGGRAVAPVAATAGWQFNITINAPGGNPQAVAAAAQTGVLAAARSMGLA